MAKQKQTALAQAMSRNKVGQSKVPEVADFDTGAGDMEAGIYYPATPRVIDFAAAARQQEERGHRGLIDDRDENEDGLVMTPKRIRARARRAIKKRKSIRVEDHNALWKPIEDWDMEELAHGRPRAADGSFRGRKPAYITRELHEQAMENFKSMVRSQMNGSTVDALMVLTGILTNQEYDAKGRPTVPASTKADVAKWMVEHVLGKAVQPTTTDISVKLQMILGAAMVNPENVDMPAELEGYKPAHIGHRVEQVDSFGVEDDDEIHDAEVVKWGE
jgi:hypothetical protein